MQHLMSPLDLSVEELDKLLTLANDIREFDSFMKEKSLKALI